MADLGGTRLERASLGANCRWYFPAPEDQKYRNRDAVGLTREEIQEAHIDEKTWLPTYLQPVEENTADAPRTRQDERRDS